MQVRQYLLKSNKMRKQRKQSIFDFNHIDPHIQEEELEEIKNLFRFYHKRFWCLKQAHSRFKKMNLLNNILTLSFYLPGRKNSNLFHDIHQVFMIYKN